MSAPEQTSRRPAPGSSSSPSSSSSSPRWALASRGDALTPYLLAALQRRASQTRLIRTELTPWQRYAVAAVTFRPTRRGWIERFYKSGLATRLRSGNAARALGELDAPPDAVIQVHALFSLPGSASVLYIDCTHAQSAALWPSWNPLDGGALRAWYRRERATYAAARHLFAFSEAARDSLVHDYGIDPARVTVTGAGVNFPGSAAPDRAPDARRDAAPVILFVGNDFVRKGGPELLEAFARVREAVPDARLQLVGAPDGALAARPQPGVEVLGRIRDRARLRRLYSAATVFALPSRFDPYPLVALEAMASGLPVVATRQMGTPEMIDDGVTGLLVEPRDVEGLAAALLRVLLDPAAAARLGAAGRDAVASRFTWDAVVDRMLPVLEGLTAPARA